jgi:glyoxylase-like metal-dependent hydrolase (beta-lactamase superfamily II)
MIHVKQIGPVKKFHLARTLWGRGRYYTACYWVDGVMVDTGCAHAVEELLCALDQSKVDLIINTHSHEDHIAGNDALQRRDQATVLAHPLALPVLAGPREKQPLRPYQRVMWGYPEPSQGQPIGQNVDINNLHFQVIHTPGHSVDHICLFETNHGWLFTGDTFIGGKDRALRADYDIWNIMTSLRKIARLDASVAFTGSGSIKKAPQQEIKEKIEYLEETAERVWELHNKGLSPSRIRKELFGKEILLNYITLGHFSGRNLVRSFIKDRPEKL